MAPKITYHGVVPVPGREGHIKIGPYESIPELADGFGAVAKRLGEQGFMSSGDRFRFFGHVEEDGVSRHFTATEEAAFGDVLDRRLGRDPDDPSAN